MACGVAHAAPIDSTVDINGWTVQPTPSSADALLPDTLLDPANALGHGTQVSGEATQTPLLWSWVPGLGGEVDYQFDSPSDTLGVSEVNIGNFWFAPWREDVTVTTSHGSGADLTVDRSEDYLFVSLDGKQVVDMLSVRNAAATVFNPDASGQINVGGLPLASPDDGALLNNLFDAVFTGDVAAWGNATTLFDDWLGIAPSGAADAVDPSTNVFLPGVGEAQAADLADTTSADELLTTATSNLTDADELLSVATGVEASQPLSFNSSALQLLDQLQSALDTITAHAGSLSSLVDQLFFVPLDQGWVDASEAALHGAQELASTTTSGLDIGL